MRAFVELNIAQKLFTKILKNNLIKLIKNQSCTRFFFGIIVFLLWKITCVGILASSHC